MVTKLGIYKFDGAGTEFTAKNSLKNAPKALFCPISTFQPIIGQDINLINNLVVDSFGFQMPTSCVNHYVKFSLGMLDSLTAFQFYSGTCFKLQIDFPLR